MGRAFGFVLGLEIAEPFGEVCEEATTVAKPDGPLEAVVVDLCFDGGLAFAVEGAAGNLLKGCEGVVKALDGMGRADMGAISGG